MALQPLDNRIIVRPLAEESVRASGLVVVSLDAEKPMAGTIVAIGPGRKQDDGSVNPMQVQPGDRIMFGKYAQQPFQFGGETLLAMSEMDVLFVLDH